MEDLQSPQKLSKCEGSVDDLVEAYNKSVINGMIFHLQLTHIYLDEH